MEQPQVQEDKRSPFLIFYDHHYKKLLLFTILVFLLALGILGYKYYATGQFIDKDVSLKGGVTVTIPTDIEVDPVKIENHLSEQLKGHGIDVRILRSAGKQVGVIITSDIDGSDQKQIDNLVDAIQKSLGFQLDKENFSIEFFGSSLSATFFKETIKVLLYAFLFMAIVVMIAFRNWVVSSAVIVAAVCDIIETLAVVSLLDIKLSTGGIAAFLMLIGYSVDTDVLLSNKVLKTREGTILDRILVAMKTGIMMTATTMAVVIIALIFTQSDVIRQIMIILLIGLIFDIFNTWIQNAGMLRLYFEKKGQK